MRIYHSNTINQIILEGSATHYDPKSLGAREENGRVTVWLLGLEVRIVSANYTSILNVFGVGFPDAASAVNYLNEEFNKEVPPKLSTLPGNELVDADGLYSPNTGSYDPGDLAALFTST